jgi:two-component system cell cycle sensor histidine kinase/response regulator CckA
LRARGFQVIEAAHGQQALDLASEHPDPIALLLTDVVMPGMDGVELYEALVQERPEIQVLYMSGYAERDYARLHDLAAQGRYLQKPFSIHYLATKVEQALAQT